MAESEARWAYFLGTFLLFPKYVTETLLSWTSKIFKGILCSHSGIPHVSKQRCPRTKHQPPSEGSHSSAPTDTPRGDSDTTEELETLLEADADGGTVASALSVARVSEEEVIGVELEVNKD